jgi:two-component system sensor histidine kinase KdpD
MWLSYYAPGGDEEWNAHLNAWSGYRAGRAVPHSAAGELRSAHLANTRLAAENARLRTELTGAAERLAAHDQHILEFVQVVSHHLRTPLGLIKGYVGTLRSEDLHLTAADRAECLDIIDDETDMVSRVINHLIDLTRLESGLARLDAGPMDLARLLDEQSAACQTHNHTHTILCELPATLPTVWGDRHKLDQVLEEVLDNVIRYTPSGSTVTIQARPTPEGGFVEVIVRDNGPGMPLTRLIGRGDDRRQRGAGLGLRLAQGWVEAHRGRFWVENLAAGGAACHFTVPIVAAMRTWRRPSGSTWLL